MEERPTSRYAAMTPEEAFHALGTAPSGLAAEMAAARLATAGPNEIAAHEETGFGILRRQLRSPLALMLLVAAVVALMLGEAVDTAAIVVILLVNVGLSFGQEYRSAHVLKSLRSVIAAHATVRRDGKRITVPREGIVPGDIVLLAPGDIVSADLRVTDASGLEIDESALTGESAPLAKAARPSPGAAPAEGVAYSGTTVVAGSGEGVVVATGNATEFGRTAKLAAETHKVGAFEESVAKFSLFLTKVVGLTLALVFAANVFLDGDTARVGELLLFSLALAISIVPEALPAVVTITFSRGALHLARKKVVVKRLSAIEDLGHIEVLCTDKTGTITENRMRLADVLSADPAIRTLAALSIAPEHARTDGVSSFDTALFDALGPDERATLDRRIMLAHVPFDPARRRATVVVEEDGGVRLVVKGAPESVLALAATEDGRPLTDARRAELLERFRALGREGKRVLALASRTLPRKGSYGDDDERSLAFAGLLAFEDPLKKTAAHAIRLAERLRVRVKILTGDSAEVAGAVAKAVGIVKSADDVVTGDALDGMSADELARIVAHRDVFARVTPEQKYRIIEAIERDHAVGFLGEGINDAPALSLAHVALAVAGATDVARSAADVILLDRSLDVIVDGIREGRVIFANVAKYIRYTLSGNLGNMVSIAGFSLVLPFLPMLPIQLLLVNLLTDLPLMAMAADRVDDEEVDHPRRFDIRDLANYAMLMGLVSTMFDFIFFGFFRRAPAAVLQTLWFLESVLQELAVIFSMRTRKAFFKGKPPSRTLALLALAAAAFTIAAPFSRLGHEVFRFTSPEPAFVVAVLLIVAGSFGVNEMVKRWYWKSRRTGNGAKHPA